MNRVFLSRCLWLPVLAILVTCSAANAAITTATGNFTDFNAVNGSVTSPYATLTINADTATGLITFDVTNFGSNVAAFGGLGFNTTILESEIASSTSNLSGYSFEYAPPPNNLSTFGKFTVFANGDNGSNASASIHVEVQLAAGNFSLATVSNVIGLSDDNYYFAAEYFPGTAGSPINPTGWIGLKAVPEVEERGDLPATPEPASLAIWSLGMAGLGLVANRRRKALLAN